MSFGDIEYIEQPVESDALIIIRELLGAEDAFVSGSLLAEKIGVSRPAIHGKLEKLKESGFKVEALRNRGYRFSEMPEVIHPALLQYELERIGSEIDVTYYPVIDSTNSEAERRIASGQAGPFAVVSSCQTRGRGRLGRDWYSASAENLYISVLFEPDIPPQQLQHFTIWAGIYICNALQKFSQTTPLKIKWPNDLHANGRKFAGMLTEAKMDTDTIKSIVFGVGINVNSNPNDFPDAIRQLATSLYAVSGTQVPINQAAAIVIRSVEEAYQVSTNTSQGEPLTEAWKPLNALSGQMVTAIKDGEEITGVAETIDQTGALILGLEDGTHFSVRAGDVTLKK